MKLSKAFNHLSLFGSEENKRKPASGLQGRVDEAIAPRVRGWVTDSASDEPLVVRITKGSETRLVVADSVRQDVMDAGICKHNRCGYVADFSPDNFSPASVEVLLPVKTLPVTRKNFANRKAFFIHIPKTAGSSVNEFFRQSYPAGQALSHIEGIRTEWHDVARSATMLSGHIRYAEYEKHFGDQERVLICFFRDPYLQLVSHLYWVRHLSEPNKQDFLANHPDIIRTISRRLAEHDLSSDTGLKSYVDTMTQSEINLFDNYHVRFLSSPKAAERVTAQHFSEAQRNLSKVHIIGLAEDMVGSLASIAEFMMLPEPVSEVRKNVNSYGYGINLNLETVRDILYPLVKHDLELYEAAKRRFIFQQEQMTESQRIRSGNYHG